MDEETRSFEFASTKGSMWSAQIRTHRWFANQYLIDESTKSNVPGINTKTYTITLDSLFLVPLIPNLPSSQDAPDPLSFCAKPKAKSQNPQKWMNPHPPGEEGTSKTLGELKLLSIPPHPPCQASSSQRRRFSFDFWNVDSATPGKPCVQNDLWVRWQNDVIVRRQNRRRNPFIQVCFDKRLDVIRSN